MRHDLCMQDSSESHVAPLALAVPPLKEHKGPSFEGVQKAA